MESELKDYLIKNNPQQNEDCERKKYSNLKHDIFISYSRKDFNEVRNLMAYFQSRIPELKCWFDITGIESGAEFEEKIISAITDSSYVLFALSDNSMNSTWTNAEVNYAANIGKKVIPVLLKGATLKHGWFLFKFGGIDCIDSTNELQMQKLVSNLSEWLQKPLATVTKDYLPPQTSQEQVVKKPKKIEKWLRITKNDIRDIRIVLKDSIKDEWFTNFLGVSVGGWVYYKLIVMAIAKDMNICLLLLMCLFMIASLFCYITFFRKLCILSTLLIAAIFCLGIGIFNLSLVVSFVSLMIIYYFAKIYIPW